MSAQELLSDIARRRIDEYVSAGVRASIERNKHMNSYTGEAFDDVVVPGMLEKMVKLARFSSGTKVDMCEALTRAARQLRTHTDLPYKQTTLDAILVDYVNYVGMKMCFDYALYARDLQEEG